MPPTGLVDGLDRVGIVVARLVVRGEDRGLRPFIVSISNNNTMCQGVTSRRVLISVAHAPQLSNHVLLGAYLVVRVQRLSTSPLPASTMYSFRTAPSWATTTSRSIPSRTSCLASTAQRSARCQCRSSPSLRCPSRRTSQRSIALGRTVTSSSETSAPLWSLRTQQISILRAFAQVAVMKTFAREAICSYSERQDGTIVSEWGNATCVRRSSCSRSQESLCRAL